jgi:hypothetical protein
MFREDSKRDAEIAKDFSYVVDSMADKKVIKRLILIGVLTNLLIWFAVFLMPERIYQGFSLISGLSDKIGLGLLGIPLMFTAFTVYGFFRLKFPDIEEQKLDSEVMSTFAYQKHSAKRFWIWVGSFAVGVINTGLLVLADIYLQ